MENKNIRSEQIEDILTKIPDSGIKWVIAVSTFLLLALLAIGWLVKWPVTVLGEMEIVATSSPLTIVSKNSGKLILIKDREGELVKHGELIAVIKTSTDFQQLFTIKDYLAGFKVEDALKIKSFDLPNESELALGEIAPFYYEFKNSLSEYLNFTDHNIFEIEKHSIESVIQRNRALIVSLEKIKNLKGEKLDIVRRKYAKDSSLNKIDAVIDADLENSKMSLLSNQEQHATTVSDLLSYRGENEKLEYDLIKLENNKIIEQRRLTERLTASLKTLNAKIESWINEFAFIAPIEGRLEFIYSWKSNDYIPASEKLFNVVPTNTKTSGILHIPISGAGKIEVGQKVIIKLENYPFQEYGALEGVLRNISLVPNKNTYRLDVDLNNGLATNRNIEINYQYGMKGLAEIVTKDKRLLQRLIESMEESFNPDYNMFRKKGENEQTTPR